MFLFLLRENLPECVSIERKQIFTQNPYPYVQSSGFIGLYYLQGFQSQCQSLVFCNLASQRDKTVVLLLVTN